MNSIYSTPYGHTKPQGSRKHQAPLGSSTPTLITLSWAASQRPDPFRYQQTCRLDGSDLRQSRKKKSRGLIEHSRSWLNNCNWEKGKLVMLICRVPKLRYWIGVQNGHPMHLSLRVKSHKSILIENIYERYTDPSLLGSTLEIKTETNNKLCLQPLLCTN